MDWAELAQEETEQLKPFADDPRERPGGFQSVKPSHATEEWLEDIKDEESVDSRAGSSAESTVQSPVKNPVGHLLN